MTTRPGPQHSIDLHGAVDLSALGKPAPSASAAPDSGTPGLVVDVVDEVSFGAVVQQSTSVPVVLALWAAWSEASAQVVADLVQLAQEFGGRFVLARLDADSNPQLTQAVGAQSVPTVLGVLRGQPVPLFAGPATRDQIRELVDKLLEVAAANQVTGRVGSAEDEPGPAGGDAAEEEPPLPPLHQAAFDAIEAGDLDAAAEAYRQALTQNPNDDVAKAGSAQVALLQRIREVDPATAVAEPTDGDVDGHLVRADLELVSGRAEAAFERLVAVVRRTTGSDRDRTRARLVELFMLVGDSDPAVSQARRDLANALY